MLSKTKDRVKNLKNDSSILSRKAGQKWPYFCKILQCAICIGMIYYLIIKGRKSILDVLLTSNLGKSFFLVWLKKFRHHKRAYLSRVSASILKQLCVSHSWNLARLEFRLAKNLRERGCVKYKRFFTLNRIFQLKPNSSQSAFTSLRRTKI